MQIKISKEPFLKALTGVNSIISQKPTLPILSNILLETSGNSLIMTGTDMEIGISKKIDVTVLEQGSITIPAKKLLDIVRELPQDEIKIDVSKTNQIAIEAGRSFIKLLGLAREDFPTFPEFSENAGFELPIAILQECIQMTAFAVSLDESKYVLNGMLFIIKDGVLKVVSTDGRRLAYMKKDLPDVRKADVTVIIPAKTIHEILKVVPENDATVRIINLKNQIIFKFSDGFIISRLIEGHFPDYERVVPAQSKRYAIIERESFLSVVRRASLLTSKESQGVKLDFLKNKILVSAKSPNLGELKEEIDVETHGDPLSVGFNPIFVIDVLRNMKDEKIVFAVTDVDKPGVIKKENSEDYLCVIMPMQIS